MCEIFPGVPTEAIEKFFMNMIVFDIAMPHTTTRLSPITFNDFLIRNQIHLIAPFQAYEEANKIWRKFLKLNPTILTQTARGTVDMDQAEKKHDGWNIIVDFINRLKEVTKYEKLPYYQMHYIAHVSHCFHRATESLPAVQCASYRTLWNEMLSPILYEPLVPTQYAWLPIENYADIRFFADLQKVMCNVDTFVQSHAANTMNHVKYDECRTQQIKEEIERGITAIQQNKYKGTEVWTKALAESMARISIYRADMEMCELYPTFKLNGLKSFMLLERLQKFNDRFMKGVYQDDPDEAIDELLDIRPRSADIPAHLSDEVQRMLDENFNKPEQEKGETTDEQAKGKYE